MLRLFLRLMLVVGIGMTGAACQDDGYAAPRGSYQPAPTGYSNPYYNSGYYDGGYYDAGYAYAPGYDAYAYSPAYAEPAVTYAQPVQYRDPAYAYTGDPAYRSSYGYAPGYDAYGYAPRHRAYRRGYYNSHIETQSVPRHYDPGAGYNSNTLSPWQDWKYQGYDY